MTYKNFEEYLQEVHGNKFPTVLDDDLPDHFDDWLGTLDVQEVMDYADLYGEEIRKHYESHL